MTRSSNIYVDHGIHQRQAWLLLDWIEGKHAASVGKSIKNQENEERVRKDFVNLFIKLSNKVSNLHECNYIHGDMQPSHFIQDGLGRIHLIDFGLAKLVSANSMYYTGGLVHYDPPETAEAILDNEQPPIDFLTDMYSFGSSLFFIYTGMTSTYYGSDDHRSIPMKQKLMSIAGGDRRTFKDAHALAFPELEEILNRCMRYDRGKRYASLKDVTSALQHLVW